MTCAQSMIDQTGKPPKEVCLDWASQIAQLESKQQSAKLGQGEWDWSDLEVDQTGLLQLTETAEAGASGRKLIESLLVWANEAGNLSASESQLARNLTQSPGKLSPENEPSKFTPGPNSKPSKQSNAAPPSKAARKFSLVTGVSLLAGSLLIGVAGFLLWPDNERNLNLAKTPEPTSVDPNLSANGKSRAASETSASVSLEPPTVDSRPAITELSDPLSEVDVLPDDEFGLGFFPDETSLEASMSSTPESAGQEFPTIGEGDSSGDGMSASEDPVDDASIPPADAAPATALADANAATALADLEQPGNVAEALASLNKSTANSESEVLLQSDASTAQALPPIVLPTFPAFQLQKLPPQVRRLAREPMWRLQIETSEGFEVTPAAPAILERRSSLVWQIREVDAEQDATFVLVRAEINGNRGDRLRWSILAGAADAPFAAIPLGRDYLDQLQLQLNLYQQRVRFYIEALKALAAGRGLTRDERSMISFTRKNYEEQLKQAGRVLEIAADANQLEGLLDGQLEVHAQLLDSEQANSTPLLQFGQFDLDETVKPDE